VLYIFRSVGILRGMKTSTRATDLFAFYITMSMLAGAVIVQALVTEQGMTESSYYPTVSRPPGLLASEEEYVHWVETFIGQVSAIAHRRLRRFQVMTLVAVIFALAGTSAVLAGMPKWLFAALGFVASVALGAQLVLRDQRHGVVKHETAVELQEALREFRFAIPDAVDEADLRRRFQGFRRRVETIKKRHGSRALKIMKEKPPRVVLPR
jgi:hypothetical protein